MITTVQCSICSQLNNTTRVCVVVSDFRLHHTCSIITSYTPTQSSDVHAHSDFASTWRYNYLHFARVHELVKNIKKIFFNKVGGASKELQ